MNVTQDKRKLKRHRLIYYLRVYSLPEGRLLGHLIDITPAGILIVGESPLPVGMDFVLKMELPSRVNGKDVIEFAARCLWSRKDPAPQFFASGFQFERVAQEDQQVISGLIKDFGYFE